MKRKSLVLGVVLTPLWLAAQTQQTQQNQVQQSITQSVLVLDSVVVSAVTVGAKSPIAHTQLNRSDLEKSPSTTLLPVVIALTPGVVSFTENGTGVGNSYLRIRGSDATRIGVTLNGIPLNDAESQEVFWVNLPALSGFLERVQVQRGVGSSVAGPGAFGGGLHIQTVGATGEAYGQVDISMGSYQTYMTAIGVGTGNRKGLSLDLRYAHTQTQGYIRNGYADMHSLFARAAYISGKHAFRLNWIWGTHVTGITWEGVSPEMMAEDRRSNPSGAYFDEGGNLHYYDNEVDDYTQSHLQASWLFCPYPRLNWTTTLNYTLGDGFYENYKQDRKFSTYGLPDQEINTAIIKRSNMIQRALMGNDYYVLSSMADFREENWRILGGFSGSIYQGTHFGNLVWVMYNQNIPANYEWYRNHSKKQDVSLFLKAEYTFLGSLTAFADLQYRAINYHLKGPDKDFALLDQDSQYRFFNPKIGINWSFLSDHQLNVGFFVGHKEPSRSDYKEAVKAGRPYDLLPERMFDWEFAYRYHRRSAQVEMTLYYMDYKDQLVPTGKLTDVGYVVKENVTSSYRAGVELAAAWQLFNFLRLDGNICLSRNKIKDYTAWVDHYDNPLYWTPLPQLQEHYQNVSLAYSPECTGALMIETKPWKETAIAVVAKYVDKQFYDNTGNSTRALPAYWTGGLRCSQQLNFKGISKATLSLFVDNLCNKKYIDNAWVYRATFADGSPESIETGLFPQAEINYTVSLSIKF
ncbi:MAG: TonB-dependent receptor [Prevotellaceae bacterium]|jgi:iron complex outermembrane receptor protein|nr:TonB-dependent receptor [Prevotellaceae bacterium]